MVIKKNKLSKVILIIVPFIIISCSQKNKSNVANKKQNIQLIYKDNEIDSLIQLDFLDKKYQYLDKNFKIIIDSLKFNKINSEKLSTNTYKDSLAIILKYELKNDAAVNIAFHRIVYSWKRVGVSIWEDEVNAKKIAYEFGFNHPYRFIKYLRDNNKYDTKKNIFLENLKNKIEKTTGKDLSSSNSLQILDIAFKENPIRADEMKKHKKIHNH
ncbi:hypothetical protein [Flavobacterium anhuiense]|uniref:hypothetical protein n=1 Tax=Flavobacterium anhuiense TaxID=459526 RepID=UPI0020270D63|nr:hypothetical protein [Flavobacterium anhuiense]URM35449.1 hypothetical protein LLY39_13435 [Flavobacterium anhuiense]